MSNYLGFLLRALKTLVCVLALVKPDIVLAQMSGKVTIKKLNVRSLPSTKSTVVGSLKAGEIVPVYEVMGNWTSIDFKKKKRYVSSKYLEILKDDSLGKPADSVIVVKDASEEIVPIPMESDQQNQPKNQAKILLDLYGDVFGGYSTFAWSDGFPKGGVGFGLDVRAVMSYDGLIPQLPAGFFGDASLGFVRKGSGAFPLYYADLKLRPIGYCYTLSPIKLNGKVGAYVGVPFSKLSTDKNDYSANVDFGLALGIGAEYQNYGLTISFERGFTKVSSDAKTELYNQCVFLSFSYKFKTISFGL